MLKLLMLGSIIIASPHPIPTPKPTPIKFKVGTSEYEKQLEIEHAAQVKEEQSWINGTATQYCNCKDVMNGETGITASGYNLDNGITYHGFRILAADQSVPLGTTVDIRFTDNSIIKGVVLDRGGDIHTNHFDIVGSSRSSAMAFGRQEMKYKLTGRIDVK